jgi:tripartite-type tricarboxylate transporter receptor subunit TctC
MTHSLRATTCLAAAFGIALGATSGQAPAAYPEKPVRVVVGFPAGSSADVTARGVAQKLTELLGQQFIVENRPGASSNIAAEAVVRAPADGYTLLLGTIANTINAKLFPKLPFDFTMDLAPIALLGTVPNILVVHPSLEARTLQELIALAKPRPGQILYASSGSGTSPHLSGELFNEMAGVKLEHVPYKGSSEAITDLIAGRVPVMFAPASTALPHIKSGRLRALASTGKERAGVAPTLPTMSEAGLTGFETTVWFGLLAPRTTPPDIIQRLSDAVNRALESSDVKERLAAQGIDVTGGSPAEFARYIRQETDKWGKVVERSGAKAD